MTKNLSFLLLCLFIWFPFFSNGQVNNAILSNENNSTTSNPSDIDTTEVEDQFTVYNIQSINNLIQSTEKLIIKVEGSVSKQQWANIDSIFSKKEKLIEKEYEHFKTLNQHHLSKFFLSNTSLTWLNYRIQIQKWQSDLDNQLGLTVKNLNSFLVKKQSLEKSYQNIVNKDFPALTKRVENTIKDIDIITSKYHFNERQLLLLQSRISDKDILCEDILREVEELTSGLRKETFTQTQPMIWNIQLKGAVEKEFEFQLNKAVGNNNKSIKYYFSSIGYSVFKYLFFIVIIIFLVLLVRRNYIKLNLTSETPGHINVERVLINHPISIIISLMIVVWFVLFPFIPLVLSDLLILCLLLSLYVISKLFNNNLENRVLRVLIILFVLNILEVIIWYLGDYSRIYLLFETGISIILIYPFFIYYRNITTNKSSGINILIKKIIPFVIALYTIAFIGNIFGFINLTVLFIKIAIRSSAIIMVAYGFSRIFTNISFASLSLLEAKHSEFSLKYGDKINKRTKKVINVIIFILSAEYLLNIFEIRVLIHEKLSDIFTTKADIGSIELSLSNILLFLGILYITFLIVTFIKKILEEEILRKMKMQRGVPAAISMILRIFFVSLGVLLALSAVEMEMSNLVMLIGALGVGIGFGLQSIVLNFISGLILVFERPIQVGDTIEVNNLLGRVKDIGIRASNVTTYDGAEVVVPNSNLISNELINWTLSDSRKRVEIKVGTAYGSNPNQVLELLRKVALNHPDVFKVPEPRPLFEGFGDSSLNFRLLAWVSFEKGLATQSDIAIGIYNILAENNIQIPFPQVDLHVKNLPADNNTKPKDDISK